MVLFVLGLFFVFFSLLSHSGVIPINSAMYFEGIFWITVGKFINRWSYSFSEVLEMIFSFRSFSSTNAVITIVSYNCFRAVLCCSSWSICFFGIDRTTDWLMALSSHCVGVWLK